jgi:hypothetical protein
MQPAGNYWQENREKYFNYCNFNHVKIMEVHFNANITLNSGHPKFRQKYFQGSKLP